MRLLPRSPRRRRRLLYASPGIVLLLVAAYMLTFHRTATNTAPLAHPGKAQVWASPKRAPLAAADRRVALRTLDRFVRSAALRRNLASSWALASPSMRSGTTKGEWLHGNLPVYPYPANQFRAVSYRVTGTYVGPIVDVDALVVSKLPTGLELVYSCELHRTRGRWLVDFCYPRKSF